MQPSGMQDQDMLNLTLGELKRITREYATAATESNCQQVRRTFTYLLNNTLQQQEKLFHFMKEQNMYSAPAEAMQQEISKQIPQMQNNQQQTQQFVQQQTGSQAGQYQYQ